MGKSIERLLPGEIEKRSFELIAAEMKTCPSQDQRPIIMRVIHTTADFEYEHQLKFSEGVVEHALDAIRNGACIVTDTNMVKAGINKTKLLEYGGEVHCFMADEDVKEEPEKCKKEEKGKK